MDLEKVLAEDRVKFETKVAIAETPEEQYKAGMSLFNSIFPTPYSKFEQYVATGPRVDAFMNLCVKYAVCSGIVLHVLRATVSSADKFVNRAALSEYSTTFPSPPLFTGTLDIADTREYIGRKQGLFEMLGEQQMTTMRPSRAKVVELEKLCQEYQDWLRSIRLGSVKADPKNYPTKDQLRVRDGIREKILAAATPDLILQLAVHALHHGDLNE